MGYCKTHVHGYTPLYSCNGCVLVSIIYTDKDSVAKTLFHNTTLKLLMSLIFIRMLGVYVLDIFYTIITFYIFYSCIFTSRDYIVYI